MVVGPPQVELPQRSGKHKASLHHSRSRGMSHMRKVPSTVIPAKRSASRNPACSSRKNGLDSRFRRNDVQKLEDLQSSWPRYDVGVSSTLCASASLRFACFFLSRQELHIPLLLQKTKVIQQVEVR